MHAGRLRHRVSLQAQVETRDDETGAVIVAWQEFAKAWSAIEPLSAREFVASQAVQSEVVARITMRYRNDVTAKNRIVHNGRIYNIEGVLADKDSGLEYMTLPCSEGINEGG